MSTPFIRLSRNSCMLSDSGNRHDIPLTTISSCLEVVWLPASVSIVDLLILAYTITDLVGIVVLIREVSCWAYLQYQDKKVIMACIAPITLEAPKSRRKKYICKISNFLFKLQLNFNISNTFGTMKRCSRLSCCCCCIVLLRPR